MTTRSALRGVVMGGALLLAALDWPEDPKTPIVEPFGPPVALKAVKKWYPSHPGPTNPYHARCTVLVFVDERGKPFHTDAKGCARPFDGVAEKALKTWRFEPHVVDGVPMPAKTIVVVVFMLGEPGKTKPPPPPANCNWWLIVAPTGEISLGSAEPAGPCAGWIVDRVSADVSLEGTWGSCSLSFDQDGPIDESGCPLADRAVGADIMRRSIIVGRAERTTVVIDMPPGGHPPE